MTILESVSFLPWRVSRVAQCGCHGYVSLFSSLSLWRELQWGAAAAANQSCQRQSFQSLQSDLRLRLLTCDSQRHLQAPQQVKGYNESFPKDFFVYWELLEKVWMLVKVGKVLIWLGQWKQSRRQFAAKSGTSGSWTVQRLGLGIEMQLLGEMLLQKEEETNMEPQPRH